MLLRRINFILIIALLIPACTEKPPIPEEKLVDFYIQLQLLDAQYAKDSAIQKAKADSLMGAFKINKTLFDSTMSWYDRRPDRWESFFGEVNKRLAEMKPDYVRMKRR
jgi:Domain of unknown function (DUF4296)